MAAQERVEEACRALEDLLSVFNDEVQEKTSTKEELQAAVDRAKRSATNVGVACSGGAASAASVVDLLDEVYASVRAVVEACAGLGSFPGSELRSALSQATAGFVGSFARALREAAAGGDRVTLRVGQCWAECDAMRKAPTDNRSALTRAFARLLKSMTSAVAELGDAGGGGNEARGSALAEGGGIEVVDWDEGSSEGGEEEDPVAAGVAREKGRVLCDKCVGAIKAYMRTVVTSVAVSKDDRCALGEAVLGSLRQAEVRLEATVASLHAPIEPEMAMQEATALVEGIRAVDIDLRAYSLDVDVAGIMEALGAMRGALGEVGGLDEDT